MILSNASVWAAETRTGISETSSADRIWEEFLGTNLEGIWVKLACAGFSVTSFSSSGAVRTLVWKIWKIDSSGLLTTDTGRGKTITQTESRCRQGSAVTVYMHNNFKLNVKIEICTDFKQLLKN